MADGPHPPTPGPGPPSTPGPPAPAAPRPVVRLHPKVLSEPAPVARGVMVQQMQTVYAAAGIDVVVAADEHLDLPVLEDLTVGACMVGSLTTEQSELFAHRNGAGPTGICVYFVRSTVPSYGGCASRAPVTDEFPAGRPSVVVASEASEWTLGHECGHVLGLTHVPPTDRLMIGEGTWHIAPPPTLTQAEIATIKASPFVTME